MTLIKEDIVRPLMTQCGVDRKQAYKCINSLLKCLKTSLADGQDIMISGFGQFKIRHKNARKGRNPKTKVEYEISERDVVTFQPSKVFREELNQKKS
jgi:integration host factor subunit alpha